jgi:flagellin-like protein
MKMRKSRRALSPVIATIILIAVTVAVSIAVAAWMGALTFSFMGSSSLTVTNVYFSDVNGVVNHGNGQANNTVILSVKNTGTKTVTVGSVKINNILASVVTGNSTTTYAAGTSGTIELQNVGWSNGNPYMFNLFDTSGNGVGSYQSNSPGS